MKRILFIQPWIYDFAAYDFWIKPLGLMYIAGWMRANGINIDFIDCLDPFHPDMAKAHPARAPKRSPSGKGKFFKEPVARPEALRDIPRRYNRYGIAPAVLEAQLKRTEKPDLVFVTSMMTYWYPGVFETIGIVRKIIPGTPIVLGGVYATLCTEHAMRFSGADYVIPGEAEAGLPGFLKGVFDMDLRFKPCLNNLDSYPYPAFDIFPVLDQVPILTSRGCPYRCTYCASRILHPTRRTRDPMKVVDEIEYWHRGFGVRHFSFYDDALLAEPQNTAVPMFKEILRRGLTCNFHCPNGLHARTMTGELARLMFRAGVRTIRLGFETSDIARQIATGEKASCGDLRKAVIFLRRAGYAADDIGVYLLCGLPGQSRREIFESIQFVKSCGAKPVLAEFSPIPGTPIWEQAVQGSPYDITSEPLFHNNTLLPCRSSDLTYEMFRELKRHAKDDLLQSLKQFKIEK